MTRWNLSVPEETDRAVRTFLSQNGEKMGHQSQFVNDAVCRRIVGLTASKVKNRIAHYDQSEILALVDKEVDACREGRS